MQNKNRLETALKVKISQKAKEIILEGESPNEFLAEKVVEAMDLGFITPTALQILEEDFMFEKINIKNHTKRKDLERIRGRIIGIKGKTLGTLQSLTNCHLALKNNFVGIIGPAEWIENAQTAIISLIKGSKQANVYAYLEHHRVEAVVDLGIKAEKKKKKREKKSQ